MIKQEHAQLSLEAHERADLVLELNKMTFVVQALVAQCEDLKVKYHEEQDAKKLYVPRRLVIRNDENVVDLDIDSMLYEVTLSSPSRSSQSKHGRPDIDATHSLRVPPFLVSISQQSNSYAHHINCQSLKVATDGDKEYLIRAPTSIGAELDIETLWSHLRPDPWQRRNKDRFNGFRSGSYFQDRFDGLHGHGEEATVLEKLPVLLEEN
ncbi:hypothetical protein LguiA_013576 [Lonicera macranthoides]